MRLKISKFFNVRCTLSLFLIMAIAYACFSCYYKIKYWGFTLSPKEMTDILTGDTKQGVVELKPYELLVLQ